MLCVTLITPEPEWQWIVATCQHEFWNKGSQVVFVQHTNLYKWIYQLKTNLLEKPLRLLSLLSNKKLLKKKNGYYLIVAQAPSLSAAPGPSWVESWHSAPWAEPALCTLRWFGAERYPGQTGGAMARRTDPNGLWNSVAPCTGGSWHWRVLGGPTRALRPRTLFLSRRGLLRAGSPPACLKLPFSLSPGRRESAVWGTAFPQPGALPAELHCGHPRGHGSLDEVSSDRNWDDHHQIWQVRGSRTAAHTATLHAVVEKSECSFFEWCSLN